MTTPFIGEIQMFGFNYNPLNWAFCNGGLIPITQNTALFSLLGTTYGGDGRTTFQLPNFAGRGGCEQGQGPGLTYRAMGETFGTDAVTLAQTEMPSHNHGVSAYAQNAPGSGTGTPTSNGGLSFLASSTTSKTFVASPLDTQMAPGMIAPSQGGSSPHDNQQPYLGVNFCIALQGTYPSFP
jgi:microcystin-dependent protein